MCTFNFQAVNPWSLKSVLVQNRDAWPEIEKDGDCIVTACLSQVLSDIWSLLVIINNDIVIIIITTIRIIITNINLIKLSELPE